MKPVTDELEIALLKSITEEHNNWQVTETQVDGAKVLNARHRSRGVIVQVRPSTEESRLTRLWVFSASGWVESAQAWSSKLKYSREFSERWLAAVEKLHNERVAAEDAATARAVRDQNIKAFASK